ncbi:TIM barrel protein [Corynebacterium alimapuense]|uniref:Xylose isomerase-like TIM barrel domain-containing protein n=1 Tax=Corynebacterium alimapuense TaxID=1576874 RepID=A0A3M8K516_9CORY|nr:TIM barrel protein [Corynebacterium alimapuense]RNE48317.1 hypothetical protein C5L39_07285 [Corynebacterium alimapuense]
MITAMNCSIGRATYLEGLDAAVAAGISSVELWWPFPVPDPAPEKIDGLIAELAQRELELVALNLWGGNLGSGDRGVLHQSHLPPAHLDAVVSIHEATGVNRFNLLLGRGGKQLSQIQVTRFAEIAEELDARCGGLAMIEPLSGVADYPVTTIAQAQNLLERAGAGGLLLDLYHVAVNAQGVLDLAGVEPAHLQIADFPGRGAPGTGELPLQQWIDQLREGGYDGLIVGEWLPRPECWPKAEQA